VKPLTLWFVRIATLKDSRGNTRSRFAMPSCEVQRTLVKSPPELWAELSDPASLARHLGEFGEIRIVRVEPETAVEWEADDVKGAVGLKPSGWGTKVTLTIARAGAETPEPPEEAAQSEPAAVIEPELETEAVVELATEAVIEPATEAVIELEPVIEPATEAVVAPEPERRPGLFARIFRHRRNKARPIVEPEPVAAEESPALGEPEPALPEAVEPEPTTAEPAAGEPTAEERADLAPEPTAEQRADLAAEPMAEQRADLAAELAVVEQAIAEQDATLLSAVLDRLGAAHHRPFSRG
jgi:hypothetical protein